MKCFEKTSDSFREVFTRFEMRKVHHRSTRSFYYKQNMFSSFSEDLMTLSAVPWGRDRPLHTSERAGLENWAWWQNRINRASLVMLAEEGEERTFSHIRALREKPKKKAAPN